MFNNWKRAKDWHIYIDLYTWWKLRNFKVVSSRIYTIEKIEFVLIPELLYSE